MHVYIIKQARPESGECFGWDFGAFCDKPASMSVSGGLPWLSSFNSGHCSVFIVQCAVYIFIDSFTILLSEPD